MPSTIVLYTALSNANTGGSWTYTGTTTPNPAAPGTYNGSIDFNTYAAGDYEYTYTVTVGAVTHSSKVTVGWLGDSADRINDTCATAFEISGTTIAGTSFDVTVEDNNYVDCPEWVAPSLPDPLDYPANWNQGTYTGDLWYKFELPPKSGNHSISFQVSSEEYAEEDRAKGFAVQFFSNVEAGYDCADDVDIWRPVVIRTSNKLLTTLGLVATQAQLVRFRVVSITPGKFKIRITSIC